MRRWLAVLGAVVLVGAGTTVALAASGTTIVVSPAGDDSGPRYFGQAGPVAVAGAGGESPG